MENKYENYLLYGLLAVVILVLLFAVLGPSRIGWNNLETGDNSVKKSITGTPASTNGAFETITTGSTDPGDVSLELTPYELSDGQFKVRIAANTHSVDLSQFDFKQITTLNYNGKPIKPLSAPILSGHHANGELIFSVEGEAKTFTLEIKGIPKIETRTFKW